jgi:hypothetical protein
MCTSIGIECEVECGVGLGSRRPAVGRQIDGAGVRIIRIRVDGCTGYDGDQHQCGELSNNRETT